MNASTIDHDGRFDEVEEVIAHLGAFGARRFGGPYVHAAIDGHRVDGQNLDGVVVIEGQRVRERRLARGGGTDQRDRDVFGTHEWSRGIRTL